MHAEIVGTTLPVLEIRLDPGDDLVAEPAQLSWMRGPVRLNTKMMTAGAGGLFGVFGRALAGGGLFMTEFTVEGGPGEVAFAARVPGTIHAVGVEPGRGMLIHRNGFLCATGGVELGIGFQQSLGAGIFGGNGFILQRLTGQCTAWVELGGETVVKDLAPGEQIFVHPGHVGMFEERVGFEITTVPGVRNMLFGGDGLFLAVLTGPGRVWLQTLTLPGLAHALMPYLPQGSR